MKNKAIGFDWGGVLSGRPSKYFVATVSEMLGVSGDEYRNAWAMHNKKLNRGEATEAEVWGMVLEELDRAEKFEEVFAFTQDSQKGKLNADVLGIVDELREKGYKVGLLSNNTAIWAEMMRQSGLDKHFDVFHISEETGLVKPEPESFFHLSSELGVDISDLIFIDDSAKSLSTSGECGFTPIRFEDSESLRLELEKLSIL